MTQIWKIQHTTIDEVWRLIEYYTTLESETPVFAEKLSHSFILALKRESWVELDDHTLTSGIPFEIEVPNGN